MWLILGSTARGSFSFESIVTTFQRTRVWPAVEWLGMRDTSLADGIEEDVGLMIHV